jgi:Uma2 family endonuclease
MSVSTLDWPDAAVSIPASVRDLNSFVEWAHSEDFPRHVKISYIGGELIIEMDAQEFAVNVPASVRDLDSFREWAHSDDFPQRGKITYIQGEILIDMSPQEVESHAKVKGAVYRDLGQLVDQEDLGDLLPDPTMLVHHEAGVSNEPDATFCSWDSLHSKRVEYRERKEGSTRFVEVVGSPDMVLEVVSRSSFDKDTKKLAVSYFNAGIDEYWLVDARGDEIDFRILVRGKSRYRKAPVDSDGYVTSKVFARRFRQSRDRNPVGGFRYRLEDRPMQAAK